MKILFADDDIDDHMFFEEAVFELNPAADLVMIPNGLDLLNYMRNLSANEVILFLDMNMPLMNGTEFLKAFSKEGIRSRFSEMKIIVYSTSMFTTGINELKELGADHYVQKPYEFEQIKATVEFCCSLLLRPQLQNEFVIELTN